MMLFTAYVATAVVFAVLDVIWLLTMIDRYYRPVLGDILLPRYDLPAAIVFYVVYVLGIVVFAVAPAIASGQLADATIDGALLGFFAFATYDMTNKSTLRNWTWTLSFIDIAWGTCLTAVAATGGCLGARFFG